MGTQQLNEFDRFVSRMGARIESMSPEEYVHIYFHMFDTLPPPDRELGRAQLLEEIVNRATKRSPVREAEPTVKMRLEGLVDDFRKLHEYAEEAEDIAERERNPALLLSLLSEVVDQAAAASKQARSIFQAAIVENMPKVAP